MKVFFTSPTKQDQKELEDAGLKASLLDDRVKIVAVDGGTGRQVYRGEDGRYYLRDVSNREPFAKWYICGKRRVFEDGNEPRANLIFQCGEQQEKVIYDDWNGVAAYSDTFNPNFYKEA